MASGTSALLGLGTSLLGFLQGYYDSNGDGQAQQAGGVLTATAELAAAIQSAAPYLAEIAGNPALSEALEVGFNVGLNVAGQLDL